MRLTDIEPAFRQRVGALLGCNDHFGHDRSLVVAPEDAGRARSVLEAAGETAVEVRENPSVRPGTAYLMCSNCIGGFIK